MARKRGRVRPNVIVFAGPCLPRGPVWQSLIDGVEVRPPAQRGDVLAAAADHPDVILLLDGYYFTVPSVTHKELLYALNEGVSVIGAASMGAIRAVELGVYGMRGVGCVFEWYRSGELTGDDEVALLHAPAQFGYVPLTIALVEIRYALNRLVHEQTITRTQADELVVHIKRHGFVERNRDLVVNYARSVLPAAAVGKLMELLREQPVKERDALAALRVAKGCVAPLGDVESAAAVQGTRGEHTSATTGFLNYFKELSFAGPSVGKSGNRVRLAEAWSMTQLIHRDAPEFVRWQRLRYLIYSSGEHAGLEAPIERMKRNAHVLQRLHERRFGHPLLPRQEYDEEGRLYALAEVVGRSMGGMSGALKELAQRIGVDAADPQAALLSLLGGQPDVLPSWWLVRAFSFSDALPPALALAAEALEIHGYLRTWSDGASVAWETLENIASEMWGCLVTDVVHQGARRGLFQAPGASEGLRQSLELVAAAERLPNPINDYPARRAELRRSQLLYGDALPDIGFSLA